MFPLCFARVKRYHPSHVFSLMLGLSSIFHLHCPLRRRLLISLQLFLWLASGGVSSIETPVELDLISRLGNDDISGPVLVKQKEQRAFRIDEGLASGQEPSNHLLHPFWHNPSQYDLALNLATRCPVTATELASHAGIDIEQVAKNRATSRAKDTQRLISDHDHLGIGSIDGHTWNRAHQGFFDKYFVDSYPTYLGYSHESTPTKQRATVMQPNFGVEKSQGSRKDLPSRTLETIQASSGLASNNEILTSKDAQKATERSAVISPTLEWQSWSSRHEELVEQRSSCSNKSPKLTLTLEHNSSLPSPGQAAPMGMPNFDGLSETRHILAEKNFEVNSGQGFGNPINPSNSSSKKNSDSMNPERLTQPESVWSEIASDIAEYSSFRSKWLTVYSPSKATRERTLHLVEDYLGELELKKLEIQDSMSDLCDYLRKIGPLIGGASIEKLEVPKRVVEHRISAVHFGMKTCLYFMSVISDTYSPPLFKSEKLLHEAQKDAFQKLKDIWMLKTFATVQDEILVQAISRINAQIQKIESHQNSKRIGLAWIFTSFAIRKLALVLFESIRSEEEEDEFNQLFKTLIGDKILQAGKEMELFDPKELKWNLDFPANFRIKLPGTASEDSKIIMVHAGSSSQASHKRGTSGIMNEFDLKTSKMTKFNEELALGRLTKQKDQGLPNNDEILSEDQANSSILFQTKKGNKSPHSEVVGFICSYRAFRDTFVSFSKRSNHKDRQRGLHSALDHFGQSMVYKRSLDKFDSEHSQVIRVLLRLQDHLTGIENDITTRSIGRHSAIVFSVRAALYHIGLLSSTFSPPLFQNEDDLVNAQVEGFKYLYVTWEAILSPKKGDPSSSSTDISTTPASFVKQLFKDAWDRINKIEGRHQAPFLSVSWATTAIWMYRYFPAIYNQMTKAGCLDMYFKCLMDDMTLMEAKVAEIGDETVDKINMKFENKFKLRWPV